MASNNLQSSSATPPEERRDANPQTNNPRIFAYAVKLPAFWPEDPEAYFAQIEANFRTSHITVSKTKYDYLLQALTPRVVSDVFDVVRSCAESEDPYTELKTALINRNTPSESKRLEDLLHGAQIGDKTPSAFYRHLCNLAGSSASFKPELIRSLWLRRLPQQLEIQLQPFEKDSIDSLTKYADGIYEVLKRSSTVSSLTNPVEPDISSRLNKLEALIAKISLNTENKPQSRSRSRSNSRKRPQNNTSDSDLCWFHEKWGDNAKNCKGSPCPKYSAKSKSSKN